MWKGYVTQYSSNALAPRYDFELRITGETGVENEIVGETTIRLQDNSAVYAVMEFRGEVNSTGITIRESRIKEQYIYSHAYWCLKELTLKRSVNGSKTELTGGWESDQCTGDGEVYLERIDLPQ